MTLRCAVDRTTTANLRAAKLILDRRSFIGKDGHLYFFGQDKSRLRPLIFKLHRSKCAICGARANEMDSSGNWHHRGKCDCPTKECSEIRCDSFVTGRPCHAHRTSGFRRVAPDVQDKKQPPKQHTGESTDGNPRNSAEQPTGPETTE